MKAAPEAASLEETTVWSFPARGAWATHNGDYPGNWPPQVARNLILRYSPPGGTVLDPMCGSGTTLIECALLNRNAIGVDVETRPIEMTRTRCRKYSRDVEIQLVRGDARDLHWINSTSVDLVTLHPPYASIISYGSSPGNLSATASVDDFCDELSRVVAEAWRVLRPNGFIAMMMGDIRRNGRYIPLGYHSLDLILRRGFVLKEHVIKLQWNCSSTPKWVGKRSFLKIQHEHLFIAQKQRPQ